ncbi:copper amine oxidase N-terminal domain-containing protein [Cohnella nanjingensis]|uniref:Copper amine oxidase N-terminal domain-containing protein n=1 Tax=Cohnella nanjingensis TaxID=1387779 RepID=A0A7X0VIF9_9BACL|nr:copper amine oxidase N-terminal domain-containing protein [Cohnella nanjingensis]MBB6675157.1 copper amine oxidase N-terminal domain-containing protein [Cohnella nanjingensis]
MKKWWIGWTAAAALLASAGTASVGTTSAAAKDQPIQVKLNGSALQFETAPVIVEGRVYVAFRPLFKQLGYTVEYAEATKRIKAKSDQRELEMTVGGADALVGGQSVPIDGQLKVINGSTFIGVKFLGSLSDKKVSWQPESRTVAMVDNVPVNPQEAALYPVLEKLATAEAAADADAMVSLFADDSPQKAEMADALKAQFQETKTATSFVSKEIRAFSDQEATLVTVEETKKVSGGFYPNNRSEVQYTLHPGADGQWRIYMVEVLSTEFTNIDELLAHPATLPSEDEAAIKALLDKQAAASNAENLEDYLATMFYTDDVTQEDVAEQLQQVFDDYDAKLTLDKVVVADYNGSDRATLLFVATTEVNADGQTVKNSVTVANAVQKQNGQWLLDPVAQELSVKPIS